MKHPVLKRAGNSSSAARDVSDILNGIIDHAVAISEIAKARRDNNRETTRHENNPETIYVICPHCTAMIEVPPGELRCSIFRHGIVIASGQQIPPHLDKRSCEEMKRNGSIIGCAGPFRVFRDSEGAWSAEICSYDL